MADDAVSVRTPLKPRRRSSVVATPVGKTILDMASISPVDPGSTGRSFLGGWRHKITGVVYVDACTQIRRRETNDGIAQTGIFREKFTSTRGNEAVQTDFFPDVKDRLLTPGKTYLCDAEMKKTEDLILESVVKIQRFYRSHRRVPEILALPPAEHPDQETGRSYRSCDFVILNRTSPKTRADFELLYNLLDRWRLQETKQFPGLFEPSRRALCAMLLSKEIQLLRAIDNQKTAVKLKRRRQTKSNFLDELSKPLTWNGIPVETPLILLAQQMRQIYHLLCNETSSNDRSEVLTKLKKVLEHHTCNRSHTVRKLIDQEINLSNCKVDSDKLNFLRDRLTISFLTFARDFLIQGDQTFPDFQRSEQTCRSCGRLLPIKKFPRGKSSRSSSCNYCLYVKARRIPRIVYEPYEKILRDLRRSEVALRCHSSLAHVIDVQVVYHLVNDIWHGKSGISDNNDFGELRLARFYRNVDWSPWNSILLTEKETRLHMKIDNLERFYGPMLLQKFRTRNLQAKVYFRSMFPGTDNSDKVFD